MRYLGGKSRIVPHIEALMGSFVEPRKGNLGTFCDLFAGTGVVGQSFKGSYRVMSNDLLYFSYVIQKAKVGLNGVPSFKKLEAAHGSPYALLNDVGFLRTMGFSSGDLFLFNNYSPSGGRMFLTGSNAEHADLARLAVEQWKNEGVIGEGEYFYLLTSLLEGVSKVSNIAGTYGAYLKTWQRNALTPLVVEPFPVANSAYRNEVFNEDANVLIHQLEGEVLYLDPPYNGRQYLSNYHLLETLSRYDYPEVVGVTGQPVYPQGKSDYCKKTTAKGTLEQLVNEAKFEHIIVSYSTEGIIADADLMSILGGVTHGGRVEDVKRVEIPYKRFKSNTATEQTNLKELLYYVKKS